ncbi:MAG: hypothetical protein JSS57_27170 [Proteobacteria bacterium]|nr:hypothetical protein [Pseudomonadota bacterium]
MNSKRTHTPPYVKWLANELAALSGEIERIDEEMARLAERRAAAAATLQALSQAAAISGFSRLGMFVPPVRAHGKYGVRGSFRNLLVTALKNAAPKGVDTLSLVELAVQTFGLVLATNKERQRFRDHSLAPVLRHLVRDGLVERLHDPAARNTRVGVWRWKAELPTLEALAIAQRSGAMGMPEGEPKPHEIGVQVWEADR